MGCDLERTFTHPKIHIAPAKMLSQIKGSLANHPFLGAMLASKSLYSPLVLRKMFKTKSDSNELVIVGGLAHTSQAGFLQFVCKDLSRMTNRRWLLAGFGGCLLDVDLKV